MKNYILILLFLFTASSGIAQQQSISFYPIINSSKIKTAENFIDSPLRYFHTPIMANPSPMNNGGYVGLKTNAYWLGSATTQQTKSGSLGTVYLWDVQGNLRESRGYIHIKRKNRFGFNYVFPNH